MPTGESGEGQWETPAVGTVEVRERFRATGEEQSHSKEGA